MKTIIEDEHGTALRQYDYLIPLAVRDTLSYLDIDYKVMLVHFSTEEETLYITINKK